MASVAKSFNNRIYAISKTRGAVAELVRKTGISRQTVDRWIAGTHAPDLHQLDAIANALNISPADLLDPGAPAIPQDRADVVQAILRADPHLVSAIRTLLLGYGKGVETDPPPSSRASLPEHRDHLPEKRKKRHE